MVVCYFQLSAKVQINTKKFLSENRLDFGFFYLEKRKIDNRILSQKHQGPRSN